MNSNHGTTKPNEQDYSPTPFLFINDEFDEEEIVRQLDFMAENGIKSFFYHVRDGITKSAYGTDIYFENFRFTVEKAAERGIKVWLYDEDSYPSGNLGGQLVIDHPELQATSLVVKKVPVDGNGIARIKLGKVRGMCGYVITKENGREKVKTLKNCFGPVRDKWYRRDMDKSYFSDMRDLKFNHVRAATSYAQIMFEVKAPVGAEVYCAFLVPVTTDSRFGTQVKCLNKKTSELFIQRVHERYKEYAGKYFGNVIPGIFMDEPSVGGCLPYDEEIESFFEKKFGYKPENHYYKLSHEYNGDCRSFRRDYVKACSEMFCINFLKPIGDWCKKNGLKFTGHFGGEENLSGQMLGGCSIYRAMQYMHIKGFDIIGNNIGDYDHPSLNFGARMIVSAAAQSGCKRVAAESFALNPFNFGYRGMKLISDWLFALGINWIVPHGFHYGYSAMQRSDAGKSLFFQDPLFNEYKEFALYAERVGKLLASDNLCDGDVLIVMPDAGLSEEVPFPIGNNGIFPSERAEKINSRLYSATRCLFSQQVQFEICDTEAALTSDIKNGKIYIGKRSYGKVLVIEGGEVEYSVYERLKKNAIDCILFNGNENLSFNENMFICEGGERKNLLYLRKENVGFIFNNSRDYVKFSFKDAVGSYVYDAEKDCLLTVDDGRFALNGYESVIVYFGKEKIADCAGSYVMSVYKKTYLDYKDDPQWVYMPAGAKKAITEYILTAYRNGKEIYSGKTGFSRMRDLFGTSDKIYRNVCFKIPYFDTAERKDEYPVRAEFCAYVEKIRGTERILFDKGTFDGEYYFLWNGKRINPERIEKTRVYDVGNMAFKPEWKDGLNEFKVVFENADEFDGVNGEVYIID